MSVLKNMENNLNLLINSIESGDSIEKVIQSQVNFTVAVESAMKTFKEGNIKVEVSEALPIVMYEWVVKELPLQIKNRDNHSKILNELILFKNTIKKILHPKEE